MSEDVPMRELPLRQQQSKFAFDLARLVIYLYDKGYECTLGEVYRPKEMAELYARQGKGVRNSIHEFKMGADVFLFKDGTYLTDPKEYEFAGVYWEALDTDNVWGGRWASRDAVHFSNRYGGRA